jgi:hypothetical protein
MDTREAQIHARNIAQKHEQRAVIVIGLDDTGIVVQSWARTGQEQKVTDRLVEVAMSAILDYMQKNGRTGLRSV